MTPIITHEDELELSKLERELMTQIRKLAKAQSTLINSISEPVDAFGDFIDIHYADQELQRLEKRIEKLKPKNEWGELVLVYSILSDICKAKAAEALEDEDNVDLDVVNKWKIRAEEYKRLGKDALLQLDSLELEKGIKTDDESLFTEHDESDMKREKKIEDIFDDPGFLEF
ncbi:unnamed protein product [marine sediment metagenome]|uniref:Uncharacterized protein n=1 Tax=marine sediment metagenome TaxID=412755 RepID=X1MSU8_9ZZZZ